MSFYMTQTEQDLTEAARIIGHLFDCNGHYFAALARRIDHTGKTVGELTVAELMKLDREEGERFNRVFQSNETKGEAHDCYVA